MAVHPFEMLAREPTAAEAAATLAWLEAEAVSLSAAALPAVAGSDSPAVWAGVFHGLVNLEEFIHVD